MTQIITTSDFTTYAIGKTLDAGLAAQIVAATNAYIEGETKRCWGETKTVTGEIHNFGEALWLWNMDVQSIVSIKLGWPSLPQTTMPTSGYFFNPNGRVTLFWGLMFAGGSVSSLRHLYNDYISVSYTYGQMTIPADLKDAALGVALNLYNWAANGGHEIVATSVGSYRVEMAGAVRGANTGPTPYKDAAEAHFMTIRRYAKPRS